MKPKILILENSVSVTGALKAISAVAVYLKGFFDFSFVIPKQKHSQVVRKELRSFTVTEVSMLEIGKRLFNLVMYIPALFFNAAKVNRLVKKDKIAIIHGNDIYNLIPVVLRLFGNKTPYICHIRFMPDRFPPLLLKIWLTLHLRYASKIIAVSEKVKSLLPLHSKIVMIYDGVSLSEKYPAIIESNIRPTNTFLYLSNFTQGKGHRYALDAFAKIHQKLPHWKLRFVGGDMGLKKNKLYQASLVEAAQRLGITEKVEWNGFVDDVEREYKAADIALNFSESESFSMTCLEAMRYGRPLIATSSGGPVEIVDDMLSGVLVTVKDIDAMAKAMLQLATDDLLRDRLGKSARNMVAERFKFENTTGRLKNIYDEILKVSNQK